MSIKQASYHNDINQFKNDVESGITRKGGILFTGIPKQVKVDKGLYARSIHFKPIYCVLCQLIISSVFQSTPETVIQTSYTGEKRESPDIGYA
jgi:hypothetical protein